MKHQYDWSKLDAGWSHNAGVLSRVFDGAAIVVEALERWKEGGDEYPDWVEFKTEARAQLAKCRLTAEPKLPPRDTSSVLVSKSKYDWTRIGARYNFDLLSSGWSVYVADIIHITNGSYHCSVDKIIAGSVSTPDQGWASFVNEATAQIERCRIASDWRDDVMGAAPIPAEWGSGELHAFTEAIVVHPLPGKMKLTCSPNRCMELDGESDLVGCLRLSVVIERLKKRGWREA